MTVTFLVLALVIALMPGTALASRGQVGLGYDLSLLGSVEFPTRTENLDVRIHLGIQRLDPADLATGLGVVYQLDDAMQGSAVRSDLHLYAGGGLNLDVEPGAGDPGLYLLLGLRYDLDPPLYTFVEATTYSGLIFGLGKRL